MKKILILSVLFLIFNIWNCETKQNKAKINTTTIKTNVKKDKQNDISLYKKLKKNTKKIEYHLEKDIKNINSLKFDNPIELENINQRPYYKIYYYKSGQIALNEFYSNKNEIVNFTIYKYQSKRKIKGITYLKNNSKIGESDYILDNNNNIINEIDYTFDKNNSALAIEKSEYISEYSDGVLKSTTWIKDNKLIDKSYYNSKENIIKQEYFDGNEEISYYIIYEYNNKDLLKSKKTYIKDKLTQEDIYNKKSMLSITNLYKNEIINKTIKYKYDKNGNIINIKEKSFNNNK